MKTFYFVLNNEQNGPFSVEDLLILGVNKDTLVWAEGMAEWEPAGAVPEFLEHVQPVSPALLPVVDPQPMSLGVLERQSYVPNGAKAIPSALPVALASPASNSFSWRKIIGGFSVLFLLLLVSYSFDDSDNEAASIADKESVNEIDSEVIPEKQHRRKSRRKAKVDESVNTSPESDASATEVPSEDEAPAKFRVVFGNRDGESETDHSGGNDEKEYTCYYCSATKLSKDLPDRGRCPESPKKDEMSGYGHKWEESGKPVNRY